MICFALFWVSKASDVLVVYSKNSETVIPGLISDLKARTFQTKSLEISFCEFQLLEEEISKRINLIAIFDITKSISSQFKISKLCEDYFLVHFLVSGSIPYQNKKTFSLSSSNENLNKAFIAALRYHNWTDGIAVSSVEMFSNSKIALNSYSKNIVLFSISSETFIKEFVQKEFMKFGASMFYLCTDKNSSAEIQKSLVSSKILTKGTGIILIGESSYGSTTQGALAIVEKGREKVDSSIKYLSSAISEMITFLSKYSTLDEILILLSKKCPNNYCVNEFSIINIKKNQREVVGFIKDGYYSLNSTIVFPGNSSDPPISQNKILEISASDGMTNPGAPSNPSVLVPIPGLRLAIKDINNNHDILQNFQLKLNDYDCGATVLNASYLYSCFKKDKDKMGLAHIVSANSAVAYGEIAALSKLNITIPSVGALNQDPGLSNSTKYPFYTRVSLPSTVAFAQIPLILNSMGWESIALLYQNTSTGVSPNYYYVLQAAEKYNLKIINNLRALPYGISREEIKNYTHVFQEVIATHARMVVLVMNPPLADLTAEMFYDLGMRKGDIIFFSGNLGWLSTLGNKDDYTYKRLELAVPLITSLQSPFVGAKGKKVYNDLFKINGNVEPTLSYCLYYDAGYLIGEALDWTINQGKDFTNPYVLQSAIRTIKFTGCGGTIYIQKGSNDVLMTSFTIQSNSYNATTESLNIYDVGYLTPTSSKILTIKTPFVYADGTTNKPADFRITRTNCPFDDVLKQTFNKGRGLVFGICFFFAVLTAVMTFFVWKKWWRINVEELTKKEEISVADIIIGATIVIEFFQLISQGPNIRPLNSLLADIGDAVSLDLNSFIKLENGVFWWVATVVIVLCGFWTVFCIEMLFQLDEKYNQIYIFRALGFLADNSMPILGNLCFIPFISILLEVFICDHSIGNNFRDSYLTIDCYQFCWQGNHIIYVVLSAISLICYEPFAVFYRPLWQEFQGNLHVKSLPLYLMVKTVFQMILIVLNKTLKRSSDIAHGFIFTFLLLLYVAFFLRFKAYNYGRFNWWHQLSIIGVAWVAFLSTINYLIKGSTFPWVAIILAGWVIIIFIGLAVQKKKYPALLFRKKGKDTSTLFKFAFTFGKNFQKLNSKIEPQKLDYLSSK